VGFVSHATRPIGWIEKNKLANLPPQSLGGLMGGGGGGSLNHLRQLRRGSIRGDRNSSLILVEGGVGEGRKKRSLIP